ncbi:DUF4184 family protein [Breznakiella homolactica]|uniref:DUF4184 family protein n=1 Tax=Breznakiella homolactica TaxID=2798577 RepID=A0A7T8BAK8_9SPIR|nr:DUF4184 family protein [Breznakiella homolactica]QQO09125.1 DUF4184 family protein [Breznakiella homolactica]
MPFTFSHPAAVLPLVKSKRLPLSLSALVMGSIIPDFEYFFRMRSSVSHTLAGTLYFNMPLCFLVLILFHAVVRDPLITHLPGFLKARFIRYRGTDWLRYFRTHWIAVILSVLIGIASHLLWDSFTHRTGFFVRHFSILQKPLGSPGHLIALYRLFQHCSTIAGGLIIAGAVLAMPRDSLPEEQPRRWYWPVFFLVTAGLLVLRRFLWSGTWRLWELAVSSVAAVLGAVVIAGIVDYLQKRRLIPSCGG